ncbi:MAG: asparagine synthase (glutamine-hydrolyzing) [Candidatus Dormibacteria bacterium]
MCGICGKLVFDRGAVVSRSLVKAMADTIQHRGPDDEGYYVSGQIGLGFRRLSIIDLNSGHQPISNETGEIWIVFNGEIYNYQELRCELLARGHIFKTKTDTEVIVHLYEEYGPECVEKLRGMFAFAIWDGREEVLFLARDRVGIKPLYYRLTNHSLVFASEIKALFADPDVKPEIQPSVIDRFLTFHFLPGEETLFRNIQKLAPGSYMVVRGNQPVIRQYWDLHFSASMLSLRDAEAQLSDLLDDAMRLHMLSDVPVGFLLSGGFDSTVLLSIAAGMTDHPISSFTVGFSEQGIADERPYAKLAAKRFGTEHHEMTISATDFESFLPKYVWHMEEPVCEPPAIAMFYVSRLAKRSVKVLISGEGGDEAFAGYSRYRNLLWLERLKSVSKPLNGVLSAGLLVLNRLLRSEKVEKYARLLGIPFESYYHTGAFAPFRFFDQLYTKDFARCVGKESSASVVKKHLENGIAANDRVNKMLYVDTKTWLVDDLLLKADKMTMANSIELRVPFLDHKLLEFAASLPGRYKVRGFTTKYIAKKVFGNRIPREIVERKKVGFPIPYDSWLRKDLRGWLRDILLDRKTLQRGYFEKRGIERLITEDLHRGGCSKEIFSLAVLELWHRVFLDKDIAPVSNISDELPDCRLAKG